MLDRIIAGIFLMISVPVLCVIALVIWLSDTRSPILFCQKRVGKDQTVFTIYKFRTMSIHTADDWVVTHSRDPYVTAVGRRLRRTHLDELPQLVNVLLGNMTLVGPRPLSLSMHQKQAALYGQRFTERYRVKPGLTGVGQLYHRKFEHHRCLFDHITLTHRNDIRFQCWILARTLGRVIRLGGT